MRHLLVLLAVALPLTAPNADAADLHRLFEERCTSCHGHAGDFARDTFQVADGQLAGRRPGRDLVLFLERHQGGLPADQAEAMLAMLLAQATTPPAYREHCIQCHDRAADLVRAFLVQRDGVLVGRYTGRPVSEFLAGHGRLPADALPAMLDLLARVEREVHGP